jgi:hypothetical protein
MRILGMWEGEGKMAERKTAEKTPKRRENPKILSASSAPWSGLA